MEEKIVSYWRMEALYQYRCGHCGKISVFTFFTEDICLHCGAENKIIIPAGIKIR